MLRTSYRDMQAQTGERSSAVETASAGQRAERSVAMQEIFMIRDYLSDYD